MISTLTNFIKTKIFVPLKNNIISNGLILAIGNNIGQKSTKLVLFFHKNITNLVFLLPNIGQKCLKVLKLFFFL